MPANAFQVGQLIAMLGLDSTQFTAGMNSAQAQMKMADAAMKKATMSMQASLTAVGAQMQTTGKMMTRYMTLPIMAIGVASLKMYKDFETAMAKVEGLVGVAGDQVEAWKSAVLDMSGLLGRGPTELADALFYVTSAGLRGAAAMDVLKISTKGSVAGLGETKIVADLLTSAINAYGAANLSASMAGDILTATVREGKAEAPGCGGQRLLADARLSPASRDLRQGQMLADGGHGAHRRAHSGGDPPQPRPVRRRRH